MNSHLEDRLKSKTSWSRFAFVVLFLGFGSFLVPIVVFFVVMQALFYFLSGSVNKRLLKFTQAFNKYLYQILQFVSFETKHKPFPFSDWPALESNNQAVQDNE